MVNIIISVLQKLKGVLRNLLPFITLVLLCVNFLPNTNRAVTLYSQAIQYGKAGDYFKAIEFFDKAISIAPNWEEPIYQKAITYLYRGDLDDTSRALESYKKVKAISPDGYHMTDIAIWSLEREVRGTLPKATFLMFILATDCKEARQKKKLVKQILHYAPNYPPVLVTYAKLIRNNAKSMIILNKVSEYEHDDCTNKNIIIKKALLLKSEGQNDAAYKLLDEYMNNPIITSSLYKAEVKFVKSWLDGTLIKLSPELKDISQFNYYFTKLPNGEYKVRLSIKPN